MNASQRQSLVEHEVDSAARPLASASDFESDGHSRLTAEMFDALAKSDAYRQFELYFRAVTGLPLSFTSAESWRLAHHGKPGENLFCAMMSQKGPSCAACLRCQQDAARRPGKSGNTMECIHGLCETAVPIYTAERTLVGYLRTGQAFVRSPSPEMFKRVEKRLTSWGVELNRHKLRKAYFATRVINPDRYHAMEGLLNFLAQHLSLLSNQIFLQSCRVEIPMVCSAKKFIHEHFAEPLTLRRVAAAVQVDRFYLSRRFKQATGINFGHYLSRFRVEKAKALLLNPHHRVIEIAFEAGFGSLTNFGRVFKQIVGSNPTEYRARLAACPKIGKTNCHTGKIA